MMDTVWSERATCAYKSNGTVYVGTLNGLYAVDKERKKIYLGDSNKLFKTRIAAIEGSADGAVWIATSGGGMIEYRDGKVIRNITTKDGLPAIFAGHLHFNR